MLGKDSKLSILIPDGENPILILIVNCLSLSKGVKTYVMSSKKSDHMRYSRYVEKYIYYPESSDLDWIKAIDKEVERNNIDLILPIYDDSIQRILEAKNGLKYKDKLCYYAELEDFKTARNKGRLFQHLQKSGISCPDTILVKNKAFPDLGDWEFPAIVKPVQDFAGGIQVKVLNNYEEVLEYYNNKNFEQDTIVQKFIKGHDVCSNVLFKDGEILAYSCQKGSLYQYGEQSPQIAFDFVDNKEVFDLTKKLMKSLNWQGVANIDWRYDDVEKDYKVLEINARFWGNIEASAIAGVNFPILYCLSSLGEKFDLQQVKFIPYLNIRGLVHTIKKKPLLIFKRGYLFNNTSLGFALKDPIPMAHKFFTRTRNIIRNKFVS